MERMRKMNFKANMLSVKETIAYSLALTAIRCLIVATLCTFLPVGSASAATVPDVDFLRNLEGTGASPSQLAIAPDGRIYIVQGQLGRVAVYSGSGIYLSAIIVSNPVSVAVSQRDGSVYIGSTKDFSVRIFDAEGRAGKLLGVGANEFRLPQDISVDPDSGDIYVADSMDNAIKKYSYSGEFLARYDDADNLPRAVTVFNGEVFVIDQPIVTASDGTKYRGARIQVFSRTGQQLRSFGSYGLLQGQFIRPFGIAHDRIGRIYVTEAYQAVVICFDGGTGAFLSAIYDPSRPMATPLGIDLSAGGKLYVADQNNDSIRVFGIDNYSNMNVTPGAIDFGRQNGLSGESRLVTVSNTGKAVLTFSAVADEPWIVNDNGSGLLGPNEEGSFSVSVNVAGLPVGSYRGFISVTSQTGELEKVAITVTVEKPRYELTLIKSGTGAGSVSTDITELNWFANTATTTYLGGTVVTLTATANTGSMFTGWTGDVDCSDGIVVMDRAKTCTATFSLATYVLTVSKTGTGNGSVIAEGLTLSLNSSLATAQYAIGTMVTLVATGDSESVFTGWTGACNGTGDCKVTMNEAKSVKAAFVPAASAKNIVVTSGKGHNRASSIRIFSSSYTLAQEFIPFGRGYKADIPVAAADINGDGIDEIIAAYGADDKLKSVVTIFDRSGKKLPKASFQAFSNSIRQGASIAAGDLDGDGSAEIIVGTGPSPANKAELRVFAYRNGAIADTGIYIMPFKSKYGVTLAAGDIDGDGKDEILVAPGPDPAAAAEVRILKVDTTGGFGYWKGIDTGVTVISNTDESAGAAITAADLDGDGIKELIVATQTPSGLSRLTAYRGSGELYGMELIENTGEGINAAGGNIDNDAQEEVVAAFGVNADSSVMLHIYKNGALLTTLQAFEGNAGSAHVAVGNLGY